MRHLFFIVALVFGLSGGLSAQVSDLLRKAADGDSEAMLKLSEKYLFGFGVDQSDDSSRYWLQQALATDDPEAQYLVGLQYTGMARDAAQFDEGMELMEKAAEQDHKESLVRLSEIYRERNTSTESDRYYNLRKSFHCATRAGELGHREAMAYAAECKLAGKGTEQNDSLGVAWMEKAASNGRFFPAMLRMGELRLAGVALSQPDPFGALAYFRAVMAHDRANVDQKSQARIGIHEVDKVLRQWQNVMFDAGSFLPHDAFQYEIRE